METFGCLWYVNLFVLIIGFDVMIDILRDNMFRPLNFCYFLVVFFLDSHPKVARSHWS